MNPIERRLAHLEVEVAGAKVTLEHLDDDVKMLQANSKNHADVDLKMHTDVLLKLEGVRLEIVKYKGMVIGAMFAITAVWGIVQWFVTHFNR